MHCGIHQTAPSKLGWGQPFFPYQITYTTLPHTLSVSPSSLSSVSWACGMLLHCFGSGEQSAWWGCPSLTRRFQVQPEATDSRGWIWTIFLVLSPFQNSLVLCQGWSSGGDQRASGEAERAPQAGQSIFLEMALKWECWVLWWMWSETFSGKNAVLQ